MREKILTAYRQAETVLSITHSLSFYSEHTLTVPAVVTWAEEEEGGERFKEEADEWAEMEPAVRKQKEELCQMMLEGSHRLWEELSSLGKCIGEISDLMEFSYAKLGPCDYPPHNQWAFADVSTLGYGMYHWALSFRRWGIKERSHILGTSESTEFERSRDACPYTEDHLKKIRDRMLLEKSQLLQDHTEPPKATVYLSPELAEMRTALQNIAWAISDLTPLCINARRDLVRGDEPDFNDWPGRVPKARSQSANPKMDYQAMYARGEIGWPKRLDKMQEALTGFWNAWADAEAKLDEIGDDALAKLNALRPEWKVTVRAYLDSVSKWLYWTRPRNEHLADLAGLLDILNRNAPPDDWNEAIGKLYEFDDNLRALRNGTTPIGSSPKPFAQLTETPTIPGGIVGKVAEHPTIPSEQISPEQIQKQTLTAANLQTLEKFVRAHDWMTKQKASKVTVKKYAARTGENFQNFYNQRTAKNYHWDLKSVRAEIKRRKNRKSAD